jgi:predicted GNAT family N-acyltransferase
MSAYVTWSLDNEIEFTADGDEVTGEEYVLIEKVYVPVAERGNGAGRAALRNAIAEIEIAHPGMTIRLSALPQEGCMDVADLVAFYESEGFGVESCDGPAVVMYR